MGEEIWVVMNAEGRPEFCDSYPESCHEHINEAINNHDLIEARNWVVRRAVLVPLVER